MTPPRTTADPEVAKLLQTALQEMGLYEGLIDGAWGPKSELAFQIHLNYERYAAVGALTVKLSPDQQADLAKFLKNWKATTSQTLYAAVAQATQIPPELVAALHWRECSGDFNAYLHNGDPMTNAGGENIPTVNEPAGILCHSWTTAAIDAINREATAKAQSGIEDWTSDLACMCIFAEYYNGEGYRERGVPDPYVLAGTSGYAAGKYVADGHYDPQAVDQQLGVLVMLKALGLGEVPHRVQPAAEPIAPAQ